MSVDSYNSDFEVIKKLTEYEFVVHNFSETFEKCSTLEVIRFDFDVIINGEITKWQFLLHLKGNKEKNKQFVSFCLKNLSSNDAYIQVHLHALRHEEKPQYIGCYPHYKLFQKNTEHAFDDFMLPQKVLFDRKQEFLSENKLTICVKMFLFKTKPYSDKMRNGKIEDFDDFTMLYLNDKLSDVTILLDNGEKLPAHKYVLAKKSSVFDAMFKHEMLENKNKEVRITDIPAQAIESMLHYIYTGFAIYYFYAELSIELEVLKAADKYAVSDLKKICEERIGEKLTIDNCVKILEVADQCNAEVLKDKAIEYVMSNATTLVEKPQFSLLKNMHSELTYELLHNIFLRLKNQNINLDSCSEKATKRRPVINYDFLQVLSIFGFYRFYYYTGVSS